MEDGKTTISTISSDFGINQYSSGSLNLQYARQIPANNTGGDVPVEQLPFILGIKGPGTIRREPKALGVAPKRSDEAYTITLGKTTLTKEI